MFNHGWAVLYVCDPKAAAKARPRAKAKTRGAPRNVAQDAAPRQSRAIPFGPWSIAPLHPSVAGGEARGWGATCNQHHNLGDRAVCKKTMSSASNDECRIRMKMWLLLGADIRPDDDEGRQKHKDVPFKALPLRSEAELDAEALTYV